MSKLATIGSFLTDGIAVPRISVSCKIFWSKAAGSKAFRQVVATAERRGKLY